MRLRTRLALSFLLLAVVPLGAIVLYSYSSSLATYRQAMEAESRALAGEMEERLGSARQRLRLQVTSLGEEPVPLSPEKVMAGGVSGDAILADLAGKMGEALPYVESLEFIPETAAAPGAGKERSAASAVLFLHATPQPPGHTPHVAVPAPPVPAPPDLKEVFNAEELRKVERLLEQGETRAAAAETLRQKRRALAAIGQALAFQSEAEKKVAAWKDLSPSEVEALEKSRQKTRNVLGEDLKCTIRAGNGVVGRVRAQIKAQALLHSVLVSTPRDRGAVPFALDADGHLYVAREEDRARLRNLPLMREQAGGQAGEHDNDLAGEPWVVASKEEPETGLRFGIARPIGQALEEMRRTAARNFGFGLGLVGLCLAGIFPLSGRISRNLESLTAGVEQIAHGDLTARVTVRSRDEFGRLAGAFNRMAFDLSRHQEQLLEQERLRKEQELERRLLEAEHARKSRELEQARQFQLSLLPRELPSRPDLEVAVHTRTAAEVGGDYYDFLQEADGTLTVAIGDATGHGAAAGTMVTAVKGLFTGLFTSGAAGTGPARFLGHANGVLKRMQLGRMAMALSVLQLRGRHLTMSAAGMPPVLLHRAAAGTVEEVCLEATPLGALADCVYPERELELAPGDTLLLLTDGLPELVGEGGEPLGYPRLHELFAAAAGRPPREVIDHLAAAAETWQGAEAPGDDMTFVVLQVRKESGAARV